MPAPSGHAVDAQGGRFHLLVGSDDWQRCNEVDSNGELRPVLGGASATATSDFELDVVTGSLRLAHRDAVSRRPAHDRVRPIEDRRGADRDRYGTWYWISADRRGIERLSPGTTSAERWWSLDDFDETCIAPGGFGPVGAQQPATDAVLAALAITTGHRLAVGLDDDQGGLLVFDLHGNAPPMTLRWPGATAVTPFDLAATAAGGVLLLDRARRTWWHLDAGWRLVADIRDGDATTFQPVDAARPLRTTAPVVAPRGHVLGGDGPTALIDPVAIVEGPDGVLLLDRPAAGPSAVAVADVAVPSGIGARHPLTVEALDPARPDLPAFQHDVVGHDMAFGRAGDRRPLPGPLLYVADASTGGTEAYALRPATGGVDGSVEHQPDELPMRLWEAKGLVAVGGDVFYDAVGRWVPLEPFGTCTTERTATLTTPTGFGGHAVSGKSFDSGAAGCVWHRLMLDADIPNGCAVTVAARSADDPDLLERLPFITQPTPYLRGGGSELPWHDPWADVTRPASRHVGTWELLFQQVVGRYCQLQITMTGNGRATPALRAVRAWYPRFSYVRAYLPGVYQESDEPDRFLERFLANMEGLLTEHERLIGQAWMLIDPRTSPAPALDWLGSWIGLSLEPQWTIGRRRFLLRHADRLYRMRGTVGGLRALLRLYLGCSLDEDVVFAAGARSDDPARIVERVAAHRFRVLIPNQLDDEAAAMVARIVEAARPAHAAFEIRSFGGLLVVGEAQLGIDTVVGASSAFTPVVVGGTVLAAGLVGPDHPFEITDRYVSDRDRLGEIPPL